MALVLKVGFLCLQRAENTERLQCNQVILRVISRPVIIVRRVNHSELFVRRDRAARDEIIFRIFIRQASRRIGFRFCSSSGSGGDRPAKNTLWVPSGANFEIAPLKLSATNRLPDASKAKLRGDVVTLAKSLLAPRRRNFEDRVSSIADIDVTRLISRQRIDCYTRSEVAPSPASFVFEDTVLEWNSGKKIAPLVTSQALSRDLRRGEGAFLSLWSRVYRSTRCPNQKRRDCLTGRLQGSTEGPRRWQMCYSFRPD